MRGWKARAIAATALVLAAAALFVIPTVWGRPWSIEHFYARVFAEFVLERPMLLSRLRLLEPWGLDFHSDELDDFSVAFQHQSAEQTREALRVLRSYDRATQTPGQQLSTDVLDWFLEVRSEGEHFQFHDYPVNQMSGVQSSLPDFMLNVHQIHSPRDAENYRRRLAGFGVAFDQLVEGLRYRESRGVVPPRFVLLRVREEIRGFLEPEPREHVLHTRFRERLAGVESLDEEAREALLEAVGVEIEASVYPAYRRLDDELARLESVATTDDGAWKLPDGDAYYAWALRLHTTTRLSADEIHRLGIAELERIQRELAAILRAEGFAADDLAATIRSLAHDPRFRYPDTDDGRAQILADYRSIVDDAQNRLPDLFGVLPRAPVAVERVPLFKQAGAPLAYYQPPPFDGSLPGVFYANLRSVSENQRFRMRTLTYHESLPGHHLQIAIAMELDGVPFFRRVLPFTAFSEGWALYAERLAGEQGFHPTPWDELGMLIDEAFRAVRLVVDTGIHAKRWTREQASEFLEANTGKPRSEVVAEVERYIVLPGQACAYKVGQLRILELREQARRALGTGFELRAFHDVVLGGGSLPLEILERVVDDWIAAQR